MIRCKINVSNIDKSKLFTGEKGVYLDLTLIEQHGNKYGDDFMVVQDLGKEARERGEKGPILGNGRIFHPRNDATPKPQPKPAQSLTPSEDADQDVQF